MSRRDKVEANEIENEVCRDVYRAWSINANWRVWGDEGK